MQTENVVGDARTTGMNLKDLAGSAGSLSALLPFVGSLISTYSTNKANAEATKYATDMDYQKWREYLEYSDPKAQVKRLRNAGINPALAMSNGAIDSGNPSSPAAETKFPTYDFSPIAQGARDSVDLYNSRRMQNAQIENMNAQTQNQQIRNNYEDRRQLVELMKIRNDANLSESQKQLVDNEIEMLGKKIQAFDAQNSADLHLKAMQAKEHEAHADYLNAQKEYQNILNQYAPEQQRKISRNLDASYRQILAAAYEHNEAAARNHAEAAVAKAREQGVKIDNEVAEQIIDARVDAAFAEADEKFYKGQNQAKEFYGGYLGKTIPEWLDPETGETKHYAVPPSYHRHKKKAKSNSKSPTPKISVMD